jgi:hypothetical protein
MIQKLLAFGLLFYLLGFTLLKQWEDESSSHYTVLKTGNSFSGKNGKEQKNTIGKTSKNRNYHWQLPKNWKEEKASGMRLASFRIDGSLADVSLIQLAGDGGGLSANVNRWRSQISLPPLSRKDIRVSEEQSKAGPFIFVKLLNESFSEKAILGALFFQKGQVLFVKLTAPLKEIKTLEKGFLDFCRSLEKEVGDCCEEAGATESSEGSSSEEGSGQDAENCCPDESTSEGSGSKVSKKVDDGA